MRFLMRALTGLFLTSLTLGLLVVAGTYLASPEEEDARAGRGGGERVFAVAVAPIALGAFTPEIVTFGTVESARTLELRAGLSGQVLSVHPALREGGAVSEGEVLVTLDPRDATAARDRAAATLAETEATLRERTGAIALAARELEAARRQLDLRASAQVRQTDLAARGVGTDATIEAADLALSQAEQAVLSREQAILTGQAALARAEIAVDRARIELAEAERRLAETTIRAPFGAIVQIATAVPGRQVSSNEALATLIDPTALDVAFRVSNTEFSRLLDRDGQLEARQVAVRLDLGDLPFDGRATLDREAATVPSGETGRQVFARVDPASAGMLRPGDFVTVSVTEPVLEQVATLPSSALTTDGRLLVVGAEDRLEEVQVTILRRAGDDVIVRDAPEGRMFVTVRQPQLGPGVAIRPLAPAGAEEAGQAAARVPETLVLDEARRARLVAFVEGNTRMPPEAKARTLAALDQPEVPRAMVDRLEARMGG